MLSLLDSYNVTWTTPAQTDRGSMPLGNGEVGINVWVLASGAIEFYLARSDARTELDRSVKLGKVRVSFSPDAGLTGSAFRQTLILAEGCIEIRYGDECGNAGVVHVFVDAEHPTVFVAGHFTNPVRVTAEYENWRTGPRLHPASGACETADTVERRDRAILFYHRNGPTIIPFLAKLEAVEAIASAIPDCLTDRVFGGLMWLEGGALSPEGRLVTAAPVQTFNLQVTIHSEQVPWLENWKARVSKLAAGAARPVDARARTARWWNEYWEQSWIFVEGDRAAQPGIDTSLFQLHLEPKDVACTPVLQSAVTRAYVLTRFMFACMSRGAFPILYSGGLFNGMPGGSEQLEVLTFSRPFTAQPDSGPNLVCNPDERGWGHFYLWQNTRLPYYSMLARGEAEWLRRLFRFYHRFWDLDRGRAALYYGAEGQYNTEIVHSFGLQPDWVYGLDRRDKPDGYSENRWGGAVDISPGFELLQLMLDFYDYRQDDGFLRDELLPYAHDLLRFIETRFRERRGGKIVLRPIQSVETYWDTTDALPVVAGMQAVVRRILALPGEKVVDREFYCRIEKRVPDLPVEEGGGVNVIAPARVYEPERKNSETPEFYAVFPFRLFGPSMTLAIDSYHHAAAVAGSSRPFILGRTPEYPSYSGWQQHGMVAALLGLAEDARTILENNCALNNPGYRFPAMWGPIYDAVPDIDHGANILTTLQLMAFHVDGDQIRILPAWPKNWDVSFKLHAPRDTTVECVYRQGKIEKLEVTPASRQSDVRFPAWCRVTE
jgi:hypothetical protein